MTKVLVLYVFHIYNDRVKAFINNCVFYDTNIDFIIISNDKGNKVEIPGDNLSNTRVIYRNNIGYDFGAWSDVLLTDRLYNNYDRFIFVNSSVSGPFLPRGYKGKWTDIYLYGLEGNIKLFGSTINTMGDPVHSSHVQSYIFSMDKETLEYLIDSGIFSTTYVKDFDEAIQKKEVLMSRKIIENNWNIGSLLPLYKGVDFTFRTRQPEDYGIEFMDDIMYEKYRNTLWNEYDLVFIKGNRIHIQPQIEEGFSDIGVSFYGWVFVALLALLVTVGMLYKNALFNVLYRRIETLFRRAVKIIW